MYKALAVSFLFAVTASAAPSFGPPCAFGISYDSYGRGLEDGVKGTNLGARVLDPQCYSWGVQAGQATLKNGDGDFCISDFGRGREAGYTLEAQDADGECYSQGYIAGEAALDIDAREGQAPTDCQDAYNRGLSEAKSNVRSDDPPSDRVPAHCYQLGLFEGA